MSGAMIARTQRQWNWLFAAVLILGALFIEALRADSLVLPGGIRAAQVFGLALLLYSLSWIQRHSRTAPPKRAETSGPMLHEQS